VDAPVRGAPWVTRVFVDVDEFDVVVVPPVAWLWVFPDAFDPVVAVAVVCVLPDGCVVTVMLGDVGAEVPMAVAVGVAVLTGLVTVVGTVGVAVAAPVVAVAVAGTVVLVAVAAPVVAVGVAVVAPVVAVVVAGTDVLVAVAAPVVAVGVAVGGAATAAMVSRNFNSDSPEVRVTTMQLIPKSV